MPMHASWPSLLVALALCGSAASAAAKRIDFSAMPAGEFETYTEKGVTFSAVGGGGVLEVYTGSPNGTPALVEQNSPRKELRADISGGARRVSVDLGDFNADPELIFLEVFNDADVSLGFVSRSVPASFEGMNTLALKAPGIAYAVFGARQPAINGSSVVADNFVWLPVPEVGHLPLFALGLAGVVVAARRRTRA